MVGGAVCVAWLAGRGVARGDLRPAQGWAILAEVVVGAAREPGGVDFLDQIGEGLGLELGAPQPFLDSHNEDLVEGLDG